MLQHTVDRHIDKEGCAPRLYLDKKNAKGGMPMYLMSCMHN